MSLLTPTQNGPPPAPDSPRRARWKRAVAAAASSSPHPPSSPQLGTQASLDDDDDNFDRPSSPSAGDKHGRDDGTDVNLTVSRSVRPRTMASSSNTAGWRDLSYLVPDAVKDHKFSTSALSRISRYAQAPCDERAFLAFVNSEVVLTQFKEASVAWDVAASLKTLIKTRILAFLLSPHIPEYKRSLTKHITPLIPASSKHLLPDDSNSAHKKILNTFVGDSATSARNIIKTAIIKSMMRFDLDTAEDVLDVTQGWCIGKLCDEIVNKLSADDIQVTCEIQGRIALLRFVFAAYPDKSGGSQYWDLVDDTLRDQRNLPAAVMACDIADGLKDDIAKYTADSYDSYTLVDAKNIAPDSLQACADKAMRDYYKTVKPSKKTGRAGGGV